MRPRWRAATGECQIDVYLAYARTAGGQGRDAVQLVPLAGLQQRLR